MRRQIQVLVMAILCIAGIQVAFAQDNKSIADPNASATPAAKGGNMTHESVTDPAPGNRNSAVAAAVPTAPTTKKKDKASERSESGFNYGPVDYSKNPWWDPKDWDYISNQNP